jgi:signal transduction histidine kinase
LNSCTNNVTNDGGGHPSFSSTSPALEPIEAERSEMFDLFARAPIAYSDIQRPYNTSRALGMVAFIALAAGWVAINGEPYILLLIVPALVVLVDALYRRTHGTSALPGELMGTTMIVLAILLRGPAPAIHGLSIAWIAVSTALVLPLRHATMLVIYTVSASAATFALYDRTDIALIGIVEGSGAEATIDAAATLVLVILTMSLILRVIRVVLEAQDRHAEALAQERRAVQLKNEFVSMVSHELRTPLTGIAGFTDTLAESWMALPPNEVNEFLDIMREENAHLSNLVEDILVIPRLEAGQLRLSLDEFDLATEVHAVASMIFDDKAYAVSIPANIAVRTDQTRLRQILRNLLENARKYGGDEVLISGELSTSGMYKVEVSDNGSGIAEDDRERVFTHFEQLSTGSARIQQGVGLGLPIAKMLSIAMGGDLWYEERFPVGARFCFSVKLAQQVDAQDSPEAKHANA